MKFIIALVFLVLVATYANGRSIKEYDYKMYGFETDGKSMRLDVETVSDQGIVLSREKLDLWPMLSMAERTSVRRVFAMIDSKVREHYGINREKK